MKRIICFVFALLIAASVLPASVFAEFEETEEKAVVTLYGPDGIALDSREVKVNEQFKVYTVLNASEYNGGRIAEVEGQQVYSHSVLALSNSLNAAGHFNDEEATFPVMGNTAEGNAAESGRIIFEGSVTNIDDAFVFDSDYDILIETEYIATEVGDAEIRTTLKTVKLADDNRTSAVEDGVVQSGFSGITYYMSFDKPSKPLSVSALKTELNTKTAQTVWYGGNAWRVIGYDGDGVASESGTATLLSNGIYGTTTFEDTSDDVKSNNYKDSFLKYKLDLIASEFFYAEKSAVAPRDLTSGSCTGNETDVIAGDGVDGALLWPLSTKEANLLDGDLRLTDPEHTTWKTSYWWLRSPGITFNFASFVSGNGTVTAQGARVDNDYGVRPAFNLNLDSVLLVSAANGGKPDTYGSGALTMVDAKGVNEWKLTLKDERLKSFKATYAGGNGDVWEISYLGAIYGADTYVSAVIVNADGDVTYYGKLRKVSSSIDHATVDLAGKMKSGDRLFVFLEIVNGDRETDYASGFSEITPCDPVCEVNDKYFYTLDEAIIEACYYDQKDSVITVLKDIEFDGNEALCEDITIQSGDEDVTITLTGAMKFGYSYISSNVGSSFVLRGNPDTGTTLTIKPKLTDGKNTFRPIGLRSKNTLDIQNGVILCGSNFEGGLGGMINVASNATLNLSGGAIRDCKAYQGGAISVAKGGNFVLNSGEITGCSANQGGAIYIANGGKCTLSSGNIEECTAEQGGAIFVAYNGNCSLAGTGTRIQNCIARPDTAATEAGASTRAAGGGIYVVGSLVMKDGSIQSCTAESGKGGGVYVYPESGTFSFEGGEIYDCKATENTIKKLYYNDGEGGGVYVGKSPANEIDVTFYGGKIYNNQAPFGDGVYMHEGASVSFDGDAYVYGNKDGDDVYIKDGAKLFLSSRTFTDKAKIGITTETAPTADAPVSFTKYCSKDYSEFFASNIKETYIEYDADNHALLLKAMKKEDTPAATFTATGADTGTLSGVSAGQKYKIDSGAWQTVSGTSVDLTGLSPCTITVYMPGNGKTTIDSDGQVIEVKRADTPTLVPTQPATINDKGSIPTTADYQKSTDGTSWTSCSGAWGDLDEGTYYVRTKAHDEYLASEAQEIKIEVPKVSVSFVNDDGEVLQSGEVKCGEVPEYTGDEPKKEADAKNTFTFAGWSPEVGGVTTKTTYTATYDATVNEYDIEFVNEDGTKLQSGKVKYGEMPEYSGGVLEKAVTTKYSYEFAGWEPEIVSVTGDATYRAKYYATVNEYTVTFASNGGGEVPAQTVLYGNTAAVPADPARERYIFAGWFADEALTTPYDFATEITGDVTIYAKWAKIPYIVVNGEGSTWTKGSNEPFNATSKWSGGKDNSYDHFTGAKMDGRLMTRDKHYTATRGSTIITLMPAFLEELAVGEHTLTIVFDDGEVDVKLTIKDAPAPSKQTGDNVATFAFIGALALISCGALVIAKKKKVY